MFKMELGPEHDRRRLAQTGADQPRPAEPLDMVSSTPRRTLPIHVQRQLSKLLQIRCFNGIVDPVDADAISEALAILNLTHEPMDCQIEIPKEKSQELEEPMNQYPMG